MPLNPTHYAPVVELGDTTRLERVASRLVGSTPTRGTENGGVIMSETRQHVTKEAQKIVLDLLSKNGNSTTRVANKLGVSRGLVVRVRDGEYSEIVTVALGLPIIRTEEVPICLTCGKLHQSKKLCSSILRYYHARRRKAADLDPGDYGKYQSFALDQIAREAGHVNWTDYCCTIADEWLIVNGDSIELDD